MPVRLALLPHDGPTGRVFRQRRSGTVVMSLGTRKYERRSVEWFTLVAAVIKLW
jgi:hypothetical protein